MGFSAPDYQGNIKKIKIKIESNRFALSLRLSMLNRKDKYFVLIILALFQVICMHYSRQVLPVCYFQIDIMMDIFDDDAKPLLLPVAFIYFGEMLLLFSCLQRQLGFFNLLSLIGLGSLGTTVLLLAIITAKPILVLITGLPFIILSVVFIIRMWRKADMEKYIVNDR